MTSRFASFSVNSSNSSKSIDITWGGSTVTVLGTFVENDKITLSFKFNGSDIDYYGLYLAPNTYPVYINTHEYTHAISSKSFILLIGYSIRIETMVIGSAAEPFVQLFIYG